MAVVPNNEVERRNDTERIVLIFVIYFLQQLSPLCRVVLKLSETAKT